MRAALGLGRFARGWVSFILFLSLLILPANPVWVPSVKPNSAAWLQTDSASSI
jgi:hypothetical protein